MQLHSGVEQLSAISILPHNLFTDVPCAACLSANEIRPLRASIALS